MRVPAIDVTLGMSTYSTKTAGIGGVIRRAIDDFLVEEVLVDGSMARIEKTEGYTALGASAKLQPYLLCVLVKRRWDTFVAIKNIAAQLGIDQTRIHIAGIKDAKAITAQHITIENVTIEEVEKINIKDIEVRPVGYFRHELSQFYLLGNRFTVTVRAVKHPESTIKERLMETILELEAAGGIPNFFGHQRFGTTRAVTHMVGKAIVNGDFRQAAMLFLANPSPHEHPDSRRVREDLQSNQDFVGALQSFPMQLRFERLMLGHLAEKPDDFVGAFRELPFKLQMLFVQAYQSYLFNRFLSERLANGFSLNLAEVGEYVVSVERSGLPMNKTGKLTEASSLAEVNESIKTGKMRVALPLIGFGQRLSGGEMGQIENRVLEEECVKQESFRVREIPRISGKGELRPVISPIRNFKLENISHDEKSTEECRVRMSFMLLRGSYATMLLREVMKPPDPIKAGF
ncbi:MAG TPA: tRNA pseudouridine(13) synthase TruD [Candidatus Bathyarchaeia archaeon]|nr:tRNA pseudouridine(13) synthase TruD [Candidatus Bathyarchaeia archaeon]